MEKKTAKSAKSAVLPTSRFIYDICLLLKDKWQRRKYLMLERFILVVCVPLSASHHQMFSLWWFHIFMLVDDDNADIILMKVMMQMLMTKLLIMKCDVGQRIWWLCWYHDGISDNNDKKSYLFQWATDYYLISSDRSSLRHHALNR